MKLGCNNRANLVPCVDPFSQQENDELENTIITAAQEVDDDNVEDH